MGSIPVINEPTPTPNPPIVLPTQRSETVTYIVKQGDTLRKIAQQYQVSIAQITAYNEIDNPDLIDVGLALLIPPPSFDAVAPPFKILPDSELVNSPSNAAFDVNAFILEHGGYLASYQEEVDGVPLNGAAIVERVALEYSVNPRLLLTFLEYQSQWVTSKSPPQETLNFPLRYYDAWRAGLYKQLSWGANLLNEGYYLWKIQGINVWMLSDSSLIEVDPTINPGTAGVLNLMRYLTKVSDWDWAISGAGIFATYYRFFGYPFDFAHEPMIPDKLTQPLLQLPFEDGAVWSYTGGPHGGWDTGSAWAGLDFAPPGDAMGCFPSGAWVVASVPGEILYSDHGAVIQDLDGDGIWQTGWSILYMHIDSWERVEVGTYLEAGERIGHPSCEGGFSTGTHLHIARRYNGEWIAADGNLPFVMDGWESAGYGVEYNGYLLKGDVTLEAWNGRASLNAIQR
jgi:murein DD-endopeptidase MepM/ murein hydrolase activator NlpD